VSEIFPGASEKNCELVVASDILNSPCFLFISQFTIKHATKYAVVDQQRLGQKL